MKKLAAALIIFSFISVFSIQVSQVNAEEITNALTTPITFFGISGNVRYRNLGRLFNNVQRFFPAANVTVTITDFFHHSTKFTTQTDSNGNYMMPLDPGLYEIKVTDGQHTMFTPVINVVKVKNNIKSVSFTGLIFPH